MRWRKYTDKMPEQHAAELHWRHLSDKSPLHMKQHVVIDKLKVEYDAGRYEYDLNNLEYLDDSPPASAEEEADKLYPPDPENDDWYTDGQVSAMQQQAHITCAGMYTGEIDKLKAELEQSLLVYNNQTATIFKLEAENSKMRKALEIIRDTKSFTDPDGFVRKLATETLKTL